MCCELLLQTPVVDQQSGFVRCNTRQQHQCKSLPILGQEGPSQGSTEGKYHHAEELSLKVIFTTESKQIANLNAKTK